MEYIAKQQEIIRDEWFKDHMATVTKYGDVTFLDWSHPESSRYAVRYTFMGSSLFITGDLGKAVFAFTSPIAIEYFKTINLGYFMRNLSCSSRDCWKFDSEKAKEEIEEWFKESVFDYQGSELETPEGLMELSEIRNELLHAATEYDSVVVFEREVWGIYQHSRDMEGEEFEHISKFGRRLPSEFIAYLLGIQMAHEQLKKAVEIT